MANLTVFGVPMGEQHSKCDENTARLLQSFYTSRTGIYRKIVTKNNTTHYVYVVYGDPNKAFLDKNGRSGSYFGIDLALPNQYSGNPQKVFDLLQATYDQYVKNKIIKEHPNGNKQWMYSDLNIENDKIARYVVSGLQNIIKTNPELNIARDLRTIPSQQQPQPER